MAGTVTYAYPATGTVPPTVVQTGPNGDNMVTAQIGFVDADTTAVVTHNWQSPLSDTTFLFPTIKVYLNTVGTAGAPVLTWALTNSVSVTATKVAGAGTGGTLTVVLERPHSMVR